MKVRDYNPRPSKPVVRTENAIYFSKKRRERNQARALVRKNVRRRKLHGRTQTVPN